MNENYIDANTFEDFKCNQEKLIKILNHNMTKLSESNTQLATDVSWLKKLNGWQLGIIATLTATIIIKSIIGV